ncbi:MAG: TetR/AcrR family transcriptional regulator [Aquabacterium sp.]
MRKRPTQVRAQRSVEAIFEATAQIVDNEGLDALTTNKIAARAGVSVGTLYQYFPRKEMVLEAMIVAERERVMDEMQRILDEVVSGACDPLVGARKRVKLLIDTFGIGRNLSPALVKLAWEMDYADFLAQAQREGAERIAVAWEQLADPTARPLSLSRLFVGTRAVIGVIRSAVLEDSPLLGTPAFEDELVRLIWNMTRP